MDWDSSYFGWLDKFLQLKHRKYEPRVENLFMHKNELTLLKQTCVLSLAVFRYPIRKGGAVVLNQIFIFNALVTTRCSPSGIITKRSVYRGSYLLRV